MLRELKQAVDPSPGIVHTLEQWPIIRARLRAAPRQRRSQSAILQPQLAGLPTGLS
jgi:hypothetical protein